MGIGEVVVPFVEEVAGAEANFDVDIGDKRGNEQQGANYE